MQFRDFETERDREAVHRIWREIGWIEPGKERSLDVFLAGNRGLVAEIDGAAECLATVAPGEVRYLDEDLSLSCVTAVTTSRIARRQGLAGRLTAWAIARDAAQGALVSALGMFEQGFYDRLGYGTGGYEHMVSFHPGRLRRDLCGRPGMPRRVTAEDWQAAHTNRLERHRGHGACNLLPPELTRASMLDPETGFGLGYADGATGAFTHHLWCSVRDGVEYGPYRVQWMAWRTPEQLRELLGLLAGLGDQVHLVTIREPAGLQLQDLLERPFHQDHISRHTKYHSLVRAVAYWQMRICDLPGCLARTHLEGEPLRFTLRVRDPIDRFLDDDAPWRGVSGEYTVTLGPESSAKPGGDPSLPRLEASINAFTRMWLGVLPASGLALTDDLRGPDNLLGRLDHLLRLPPPRPEWDF